LFDYILMCDEAADQADAECRVNNYTSDYPLFALGFSNQPVSTNNEMFLATGSFKAGANQVDIIKMSDTEQMKSVLKIQEKYPPTKLMWIPSGALG
jgi:hypothetical protein